MADKSVVKSDMNDKTNYRFNNSVVLPQKHLAFMSLSLGFLIIWSSVMAAVLVSNSFKDNVSVKQSFRVFKVHKQISRIVFSVGHEMVSTVDWLVSIGPKQKSSLSVSDAIGITWKMTDSVISDIRHEDIGEEMAVFSKLLDLIESKLLVFRVNDVFVGQNPLNIIKFYNNLFQFIERTSFSSDFAFNISSLRPQTPTEMTSYLLFVKGMAKRFTELSFGTVLVRSEIFVEKTDYIYHHFISHELIDNAFELNPKVMNRYLELQESDGTTDLLVGLLDSSVKRGDNHLANLYLNRVKDEISFILRAKDILNSYLSLKLSQMDVISRKELAFHSTLGFVAMIAVIVCLTLLCSSFRFIDSKNIFLNNFLNSKSNFCTETEDTIHSIEFNDKIKILGKNPYQRQFY